MIINGMDGNNAKVSADGSLNVSASSAVSGAAVTPSDTVDLSKGVTKGLYIGASGDVRVILAGDTAAVTFTAMNAGAIHPISVKRVLATGTTATGILAVY